ncbi:hypothetical protein ONS95_008795 [Cadophora gregata]|uniref:uncharacterized protein n=1 Tax=Cadophora gregata TaxID=51156 RepID=UPI0026DBA13D|nr:uncharacterized protein ONS95_008795 [Cadophora gregata]KAK0123794.1 hypothetical protein ONS95_008795 [Cadophora gregata]
MLPLFPYLETIQLGPVNSSRIFDGGSFGVFVRLLHAMKQHPNAKSKIRCIKLYESALIRIPRCLSFDFKHTCSSIRSLQVVLANPASADDHEPCLRRVLVCLSQLETIHVEIRRDTIGLTEVFPRLAFKNLRTLFLGGIDASVQEMLDLVDRQEQLQVLTLDSVRLDSRFLTSEYGCLRSLVAGLNGQILEQPLDSQPFQLRLSMGIQQAGWALATDERNNPQRGNCREIVTSDKLLCFLHS